MTSKTTSSEEDWSQYYETTNMDEAVSDWEDDRAKADRKLPTRPVSGEHVYRFFPKRKGAKHKHFYRVVYLHFLHHPDKPDDLLMVGMCPQKTEGFDEECPGCTAASRLRKTGANWQQLRDWGVLPQRNMFAVAVRLDNKGEPIEDDKDETTKPFVMTIPYDVESMLMPLLKQGSPRYLGDISHPLSGFNVVITKSGKGREGTEYSGMPLAQSCQLPNMEWLKEMPDLDVLEEKMGARAMRLLGEHYPGSGFPAPDGTQKALPAAGSTEVPDEEDPYSLINDPDKPGEMIAINALAERRAKEARQNDPPIGD